MEHGSREIVSSMFDQIIAYLVRMKESEMPSDVAFAKSASKSILDALGGDILSSMVLDELDLREIPVTDRES